ncbi:MAG: hypothetical protein ACKOQ4_01315 [Mycobacterium sp.]
MKIITLIAQQVSPTALSTALPTEGIVSVTVGETQSFDPTSTTVEYYRGRALTKYVTAAYRVEIVAEDSAVAGVVDGLAFARGAGLLGEARAWVSAEADDLFAATPVTRLAASA